MSKKKSNIDRSAVFQAILGELEDQPETVTDASEARRETPASEVIDTFQLIPLGLIDFNPNQPRKSFNKDGLNDLASSITEHGLLEPILVRPVGERFEVVAGERRTRASIIAKLENIPAQVLDLSTEQAFEVSIIENLQREDLNPVEETEAIIRLTALLLDVTPADAITLLQDVYNRERGRRTSLISEAQLELIQEIFTRLGRFTISSFVTNRIPILSFPEQLKAAVRHGELEFTKAQLLARVSDPDSRTALTELAIREQLSISQIRRRIAELSQDRHTSGLEQEGIFTTTEQAPRLLMQVKKRLTVQSVSLMDSQRQAEIAKVLAHLNSLLGKM